MATNFHRRAQFRKSFIKQENIDNFWRPHKFLMELRSRKQSFLPPVCHPLLVPVCIRGEFPGQPQSDSPDRFEKDVHQTMEDCLVDRGNGCWGLPHHRWQISIRAPIGTCAHWCGTGFAGWLYRLSKNEGEMIQLLLNGLLLLTLQ